MAFNSEEEMYQEHVLDHYEDPYHRGTCGHPTHVHEDKNPLCGDVIRVQLAIDDEGRVREAWFEGKGCVISQASASMLMEQLEGKTVEELKEFSAQQMLDLFGARLTPNRQKCCLLPWRAVQTAMHSPVHDEDEEGGSGPTFAGPNLGEES